MRQTLFLRFHLLSKFTLPSNYMSSLVCPICQLALNPTPGKSMSCSQRHSFDLAKEGYLNLHLVNQKKSKNPGDNALMVSARTAFLEQGHYDPLVNQLKETIATLNLNTPSSSAALDAGCGQGYYTQEVLLKSESFETLMGMDISKAAVKSAAKKNKDTFFFVSSVFKIPLASDSMDLILSVFSPSDPKEFKRILKDEAYLLIVSAGKNHMKEMAEIIYEKFRPHQNKTLEKMKGHFEHVVSKPLTFELELNSVDAILSLLKMTPYYWNNDGEKIEKFEALERLRVTCEFEVDLFRKG